MKELILLICIGCCLHVLGQQSDVKGVVSVQNSETETGKRGYVSNAQVEDNFDKAQPALTDDIGQFRLVYINTPEETSVSFHITKPSSNLEVVNIDALSAVTGQTNLVKISMAPKDKIIAYRMQIYKIGKTAAEQQLNKLEKSKTAEIAKLKADTAKNENLIRQLNNDLATMEDQRKKIDEQAQDLANQYAPRNLDDASLLFRETFGMFQRGQLDSALLELNKVNSEMVSDILEERQSISSAKEVLVYRDSIQKQRTKDAAQALQFKADLFKTRYEFDSASSYYKLLIQLDSTNTDYLFNYAHFLAWLNQFDSAAIYYLKTLDISNRTLKHSSQNYQSTIAATQNELGNLYRHKHDFIKAQAALLDALQIWKRLTVDNSKTYEPQLAGTQANLGILYDNENDFVKAQANYFDALNIYQHLAAANPQTYNVYVARMQNNLGILYYHKNDFAKAEAAYLIALEIKNALAKDDPQTYEPEIARAKVNLGVLYYDKSDYIKAEEAYLEALQIWRRLATINPQTYEPEIAKTQDNLGALYSDKNDSIKAEASLREALQIWQRLAEDDPQTYEPDVAEIENDFGTLYSNKNDSVKAEVAYLESLHIYQSLAATNPQTYEPDVAWIEHNLGALYIDLNDFGKAEVVLLKALQIWKPLVKEDPQTYEPGIAEIQNDLGILYNNRNNFAKAETAFLQALQIRERLAKSDPQTYEPDVAETQNDLGSLYRDYKKYILSEKMLTGSFLTLEKLFKSYPDVYTQNFVQTSKNLLALYIDVLDSFKQNALNGNMLVSFNSLEESLNKLADSSTEIKQKLFNYYDTCSWYLLLAQKFKASELSAKKGIALDTSQVWIKTNLAHALLFQGRYNDALEIYQDLKHLKDTNGETYATICLEDFDKLEKQGITNKDVNKIRAFLKE